MTDHAREIINRIRSIFRDVPNPGPILLREDSFDDSDIMPFEYLDRWLETPDEVIANGEASLSFFSQAAYRFFAPAYMIWTLEHVGKSSSNTPNSLLYSLPARKGVFTKDERSVIYEFVVYLRQHWINRIDDAAVDRCIKTFRPTD
jgi:hypothetical protein